MLRVPIRSRLGNGVLGFMGVVYCISATATLIYYIATSWGAMSLTDYVLQAGLIASAIGGLLFTLEVILRDFSIRTLTPLVIASVIANFTTRSIFTAVFHEDYREIFNMPLQQAQGGYTLGNVANFLVLGVVCGVIGVSLTRLMYATERAFARLKKIPPLLRPAIGGAALGAIGVFYVLVFGRLLLDRPKFIPFEQYSMPAFFGDGYGAIRPMLSSGFYSQMPWGWLLVILLFLCVAKLIGTRQ